MTDLAADPVEDIVITEEAVTEPVDETTTEEASDIVADPVDDVVDAIDTEVASGDETASEPPVNLDPVADLAVCLPPVDFVPDAAVPVEDVVSEDVASDDSSSIPVDVLEVADSEPAAPSADIPVSFELPVTEIEEELGPDVEVAIDEVVDDIVETVTELSDDAEPIIESFEEAVDEAMEFYFSDLDSVDSLFSDIELFHDLIKS